MPYAPLTDKEEGIATVIVAAAYAVHRGLGAGLLESLYSGAFCHEIGKRGLAYARQVPVPVMYDGVELGDGLRLDVLVEELVICELKTVDALHPVHTAQLLTYMKLTGKRLGFLINFNVPVIKHGIQRLIL
jgi:GxxExxY protein